MPTSADLFFPKASFNKPIDPTKRSVANAKYAEVLWKYGNLLPTGRTLSNILVPATRNYGIPIYDMKDANTKIKVFQLTAYMSMYTISNTGVKPGAEIPYNMKWKAGAGNDRLMIIINYDTGEVWEIGGLTFNQPYNIFDSPWGWLGYWAMGTNGKAGFQYDNPNHVGVYGVNNYKNLWTGTNINPQPGEALIVGRGCGLPKASLTVRADRIAKAIQNGDKTLGHALPMSISITQHGDDVTGKGSFLFPGTRLEHGNGTKWQTRCGAGVPIPLNNASVPQSMMIALEPDFDVEAEVAKKGFKGMKARVMILLWNTAKIHGIILGAETGCGASALVEFEAFTERSTPVYNSVGLIDDGSAYPCADIFTDMLRKDPVTGKLNYYVVDAPR
jgi:hypothetical protein